MAEPANSTMFLCCFSRTISNFRGFLAACGDGDQYAVLPASPRQANARVTAGPLAMATSSNAATAPSCRIACHSLSGPGGRPSPGEAGRPGQELWDWRYCSHRLQRPHGGGPGKDRLIAAGTAFDESTGVGTFALARFTRDGTPDPTFGTMGKVSTSFNGYPTDLLGALAVQADGKLVAAGSVFTTEPFGDVALARYNPDGSLDSTFGTGGTVTTDFAGGPDGALALAVQADGKLVIAGAANQELGDIDFGLARYNPDGTLDPTFGAGGRVSTDFGSGTRGDRVSSLVVQADGKLVAAGTIGFSEGLVPSSPWSATTQTAPWTAASGPKVRSPPTSRPWPLRAGRWQFSPTAGRSSPGRSAATLASSWSATAGKVGPTVRTGRHAAGRSHPSGGDLAAGQERAGVVGTQHPLLVGQDLAEQLQRLPGVSGLRYQVGDLMVGS
jgi:uncharacterized delta-60 repeat protein